MEDDTQGLGSEFRNLQPLGERSRESDATLMRYTGWWPWRANNKTLNGCKDIWEAVLEWEVRTLGDLVWGGSWMAALGWAA